MRKDNHPPPNNNKREALDDATDNNNDEVEKNKLNKSMYTRNGNRTIKPPKERTHLKLVQINKGHAKYNSKKNLLHAKIKFKTPHIMTLSEANVYPNDDTDILSSETITMRTSLSTIMILQD